LRERLIIVAIVLAVHVALLMVWAKLQPTVIEPQRELEVTFAAAPAADVAQQQAPLPEPVKAAPPQRLENPVPTPVVAPAAAPASVQVPAQVSVPAPLPVQEAAAPAVQPSAPEPEVELPPSMQLQSVEVPAVEPDYKAAYLNNQLTYPLAAMRMGWQGRVVLNVEVLANGSCGQLYVLQGSGHELLDKAAIQTVKGWRFTPARVGGKAVTKWFKIGVTYSLKDKEQ